MIIIIIKLILPNDWIQQVFHDKLLEMELDFIQ